MEGFEDCDKDGSKKKKTKVNTKYLDHQKEFDNWFKYYMKGLGVKNMQKEIPSKRFYEQGKIMQNVDKFKF